jgi:hypothetical protein
MRPWYSYLLMVDSLTEALVQLSTEVNSLTEVLVQLSTEGKLPQ